MNYDNDSDEVGNSRRLESLSHRAAITMESVANRLALAEDLLDLLESDGLAGFFEMAYTDEELSLFGAFIDKLALWEQSRGEIFIFTDATEHVIAFGRGSLDLHFVAYGYSEDHTGWKRCEPNEIIAIHCDGDGNPCPVDEGTAMRKTAAEWLAQAKEREYEVPCLLSKLED
jgi:hypothetical protein